VSAAWLVVKPFLTAAWGILRPILVFGITLPVWAFLIAGGWLYFDKTSAIRAAVNKATTELVAGAQLDALQASLAEERRLRAWSDTKADEARKIAEAEREAGVALQAQLALTAAEKKEHQDDIDATEASPLPDDGRVGQPLLDRLRNR
jgi:hypothetical protein